MNHALHAAKSFPFSLVGAQFIAPAYRESEADVIFLTCLTANLKRRVGCT